MKTYRITVWLTKYYSKYDNFIYRTGLSLVENNGEGRKLLDKEVHKRYKIWFYYDINILGNQSVMKKD